jgi:hypothetical protein
VCLWLGMPGSAGRVGASGASKVWCSRVLTYFGVLWTCQGRVAWLQPHHAASQHVGRD